MHLNDLNVYVRGRVDNENQKEISKALSHAWHCMKGSDFLEFSKAFS